MYDYSQQRLDESTKLDSAEIMHLRSNMLNNNISTSKIKNTDDLIQSISYYDQLYS